MPIRPENRHFYKSESWKVARRLILERAGGCCEGSPAYPWCRAKNRHPHPVTGSVVVLTVAHLDQDPANNSLENLRALCQRCHNRHDARARAEARLARKRQSRDQ